MATVRLQLRRGLADDWNDANPTLAAGEIGIETDTNTFKFGDGNTPWNSLEYALSGTVDDYILLTTKGAANGVASLDSSGFIPASQLPPLAKVTVSAVANQAARLALTAEAGDIAIQADNGTTYVLSSSPASTNGNWREISATAAISAAVAAHEADTTSVHGIADTNLLVTTNGTQTLTNKTITSPSGLVKSDVGLANVDNTSDENKPVSIAALAALGLKAPLESPALTGTATANNLTISGNLVVNGTTSTINSTTLTVQDKDIVLGQTSSPTDAGANGGGLILKGTTDKSITYSVAKDAWESSENINIPGDKSIKINNIDVLTISTVLGKALPGVVVGTTETQTLSGKTLSSPVLDSPSFTGTINLPLGTTIGNLSSEELELLNGVTANVQTQIDAKAPSASPTFTGTVVLPSTTSIGNLSSAELELLNGVTGNVQTQIDAKAPSASPTFTGTVVLPSTTTIGNISSEELDLLNGVTANVQTQIDAKAPSASPTFTGTVVLPSTTSIGNVSSQELELLNGVTANVQTQIDAKAPSESPTFTGTVTLPSTTSIGNLTSTELGYLDGITSSVQTQIGAAATALSNHEADTTNIHGIADTSVLATTTNVATAKSEAISEAGTAADTKVSTAVAALTKSSVGLANVDNTSDVNKPVSTATQTELDLKAPKASPTFTGTVVLPAVTAGGSIVPTTDNTFDLGSPTKMWKDIYVGPGSLYVNGQKVIQDESGAIVVSADINENLGLRTSGSGNIEFDPTGAGSINIKGPVVVEAGANFSSSDGNGIAFSNGLKSDTLTSRNTDTDLSLSGNGTGKVYLNDNAEVSGNLVVGGNLTVSGTTTTVNSETISLADNIIDLNSNFTTGTPTENAGIRIIRGDSNAVQVRWNEATDKWEFTNNGSDYSVIAPTDSPTFTGTVNGITKSMVGLANVDNTSDASKPVSTAQQTALDLKLASATAASTYAPIASPTFTGTVTVAAAGVAFTDGAQTKQGVPSLTVIGTEISADYNLSTGGLALRDQLIPVAGARAITVPTNSTTAYPVGTSISFYQASGTGANFVAADVTVTILRTPGLKLRTTHSSATLTKVATNTWLLAGDLTA
jgi:hypothetical protein